MEVNDMANMDSVESARTHFNSNVGVNTVKEPVRNTKAVQEDFKGAVEKYQKQGKQDTEKEVTPQQLKEAVDKANRQIKMTRTSLEFTYYEEVNRYAVKVKDKVTDEVIREYPSEDSMKALENIWRLAGIIVDESI